MSLSGAVADKVSLTCILDQSTSAGPPQDKCSSLPLLLSGLGRPASGKALAASLLVAIRLDIHNHRRLAVSSKNRHTIEGVGILEKVSCALDRWSLELGPVVERECSGSAASWHVHARCRFESASEAEGAERQQRAVE